MAGPPRGREVSGPVVPDPDRIDPGDAEAPDPAEVFGAEEEGPGGPFPSWRALYWTVVVWFVIVVAFLIVFTRVLDFSGS